MSDLYYSNIYGDTCRKLEREEDKSIHSAMWLLVNQLIINFSSFQISCFLRESPPAWKIIDELNHLYQEKRIREEKAKKDKKVFNEKSPLDEYVKKILNE